MPTKTHHTAVAIVPPKEVWGPIQAIREKYDRQVRRWMPHVNLLYPFLPSERFDEAVPRLTEVCEKMSPFAVTLGEFRFFAHASGKATLWLAPEPKETLVKLQAVLHAVCPECDDLSRFPAGFTPHLSVGQTSSVREAKTHMDAWQVAWTPLLVQISAVAVLKRGQKTPFQIERLVPLAAGSR